METIKNKKILALIGIVGLLLGTFMPYYKFSILGYTQSVALWGYWEGKIVLALILANALFIFKDWIEQYIPQLFNNNIGRMVKNANNPKMSLIPTALVAGFIIYMFVDLDLSSEYFSYGLGFYLLWIGVISLVGHAIFYKGENTTFGQKQTVQVHQPQYSENIQQPMNYQSTEIQPQPQINPIKKFCPQCGNQVNVNAETCFLCGNRF